MRRRMSVAHWWSDPCGWTSSVPDIGAGRNGAAVRAGPRWRSQSRGLRGRRGRPARDPSHPGLSVPGRIIRCRLSARRPRVHRAGAAAIGHHRYRDLHHGGHVPGSYRSHREHGQRNAAAGNPDPATTVRGDPTRSRLLRTDPGQGRADGSGPRRSIHALVGEWRRRRSGLAGRLLLPGPRVPGEYGNQDAVGGVVLYDVLPLPIPGVRDRHVTFGLQRVNRAGGQSAFQTLQVTLPHV